MHGRFELYQPRPVACNMVPTRRRLLRTIAATGASGIAGCLGGNPLRAGENGGGEDETLASDGVDGAESPPLADGDLHSGHDLTRIDEAIVSGGVSKDGIPSIDDPRFSDPSDAGLAAGDPVFGVVRNGAVRAYPQEILVYHEIVNDVVGDEPVAITYCPLTGTAQGFERGDAEFGVSGRLVNSNLVMYDRGTDTWWPQMLATGVRGPLRGETLREFGIVWTNWGRWLELHPDTRVLTPKTGYSRRYGSDPYGQYNPKDGYYASDSTLFSPLVVDPDVHDKDVVIGARTSDGAVAFDKERLLEERLLEGTLAGVPHVAVADPDLQTGSVYETEDESEVTPDGEQYRVDGETYDPDTLPLEQVLAFDAMYFAWYGFYPDSTYVQ